VARNGIGGWIPSKKRKKKKSITNLQLKGKVGKTQKRAQQSCTRGKGTERPEWETERLSTRSGEGGFDPANKDSMGLQLKKKGGIIRKPKGKNAPGKHRKGGTGKKTMG